MQSAPARPAPVYYPPAQGSAVPAPELAASRESLRQPRPEEAPQRSPYQPELFPAGEMRGAIPASQTNRSRVLSAKIVSMDGYVHSAPGRRRSPDSPRPEPDRAPRTRAVAQAQQSFGFQDAGISPRVIPASTNDRCCSAPVALPEHRAIAAFLDFSMIAIALCLLLLPLVFTPAGDLLTVETLPIVISAALLLGFAYKMLWVMLDTDSPGMRWSSVKVLNFDGQRPTREQRLTRLFAGALSFLAAGLGLVWALADEESLTWHDHISKTFVSTDART
ncbi:MAG: RDD family protein [Bryobacterales bacterium]|nr:RDD family protein [Bryobacterales bacterium]